MTNDNTQLKKVEAPIRAVGDLLLVSLKNFYRKGGNKELILSIVKQQTTISLRLLDWLVTNYAKHKNIHFPNDSEDGARKYNKRAFSIWIDYKNQLKAYSKKQFDPFCRRNRIFYVLGTDETFPIRKGEIDSFHAREDGFVTTVGQLNFFRWAINNRVIDYAFNHLDDIESDMLSNADSRKNLCKDIPKYIGKPKRKASRTKQNIHIHNIKVIVDFS